MAHFALTAMRHAFITLVAVLFIGCRPDRWAQNQEGNPSSSSPTLVSMLRDADNRNDIYWAATWLERNGGPKFEDTPKTREEWKDLAAKTHDWLLKQGASRIAELA